MFRALGARLTLDHKGVPGVALFEAAAQRTWQWATSGLKTATDLFTDAELQEGDVSVRAVRCDIDNRALYHITVRRPDAFDPSIEWLTTIDTVRTGDVIEVGVSVEEDLRHLRVPPSPLAPPLVQLLHDLAAQGARAGTQRVRSTVTTLMGTDQIDSFVQACLLDPERRLPVVLFTALKESDGVYPSEAGDPVLAARELCGLAHVYVLPHVEDSHRLTKRLHMLSAYDGAVRIYWPRFRLADPPPRHPLHLRQRLNTASGPAIIRRVVEAGARSYHPPSGTATLLAIRWREDEEARIATIRQEPDLERQVQLLGDALLRVIDAKVALEHQLEAIGHQLAQAAERNDDLDAPMAGVRTVTDVATDLTGHAASSLPVASAPEALGTTT
jgi:hypothetical protein